MTTKLLFRKESENWEKRTEVRFDIWIYNKIVFIPTFSFESYYSRWYFKINILTLEISLMKGAMPLNSVKMQENCKGDNC